jgi:hypothetical protein
MECKKIFAHLFHFAFSPWKSEISKVQLTAYGITEIEHHMDRRVLTNWLLSVEEIKI